LPSQVGILTKASKASGWPENVPNGHIVLDGAEKGFVITHMTTIERNALVPVEGMMIYNTDAAKKCVELYRGATPAAAPSRTGWNCIEPGCDAAIVPRNVKIAYTAGGFNFNSNHDSFKSQLNNTDNYGATGTFKGVTGFTLIAIDWSKTAAQMKIDYDMIVTGYSELSGANAAKVKDFVDAGGVVFGLLDAGVGTALNQAFGGGTIANGVSGAPSRSLGNQISNGLFGIGGGTTITGSENSSLPAVANIPPGSFIVGYVNNPNATSTANAAVYITGAEGRAIFVYDEGIFRYTSVAGTVINTPQEIFLHNLMSYALQKIGFSAQ